MPEIKGLADQQILKLPHEIRFCEHPKTYEACMVQVGISDTEALYRCSRGCDTKMHCLHNGSIVTRRIFIRKGQIVDTAHL